MQVLLCRAQNTLLFLRGDAFQAIAVETVFSEANFDEDQGVAILHNNIDFTFMATVVSGNKFESLLPEVIAARIFCELAYAMTGLLQSMVGVWVQ